jgi:hypothetical protein
LQALCAEIGKVQEHAGDVTARARKASEEAAGHRIAFEVDRDPGMLVVAPAAACTAGGAAATIASTRLLTKSVASDGNRETSPSARRTIISKLKSRWLSGPFKPSRIAATRIFTTVDSPGCSSPTLRLFVVCCAPAASGHATAAPPRSAMNWRRFTARSSRASDRKDSTPQLRQETVRCGMLIRPMSESGSESVLRRPQVNVRITPESGPPICALMSTRC